MFAKHRVVLLESKFFNCVHGIFGRVIMSVSGFLTHESNDFAFVSFLCHIESYSNRYGQVLLVFLYNLLWSHLRDLNPGPPPYHGDALPLS